MRNTWNIYYPNIESSAAPDKLPISLESIYLKANKKEIAVPLK